MPTFDVSNFLPSQTHLCRVQQVSAVSSDIWHVELAMPRNEIAEFWPGQHLLIEVLFDGEHSEWVPYSIAAAPAFIMGSNPKLIELYIANNSQKAADILNFLRTNSEVKVTLPLGECLLNRPFLQKHAGQPLIMLAAGSGFSQIKCLTEAALKLEPQQEIHLYWSNKEASEFYLLDLIEEWRNQHPNFHGHLILESATESWQGRSGWLYEVVSADFTNLANCQVFACGSPNMVYGTLEQLELLGLSEANMHSDVFAYAPRPARS